MLKNNAAGQTSVQTLPTTNQKSTSVKKDNRKKETLKVLEYLGKDMLHGVFNYLAKHNVLTLKEEEKKKYYDAKIEDKALILVDSMRKNRVAHQRFTQTLLNMDHRITSIKPLLQIEAGPPESAESTNTLILCPHEEFLRRCKENHDEIYPIKKREDLALGKRLALIICNTKFDHLPPRIGAHFDILGMKELLQGLGYNVVDKKNLTARDMESALRAFAARPEHKSSDSTFLVLMSHGILEGICGTAHDEKYPDVLLYDTIFQIFNNRNCLSLKDKPKVIIVQACRGKRRGEHWVRDSLASSAVISSQSPENLEEDSVCRVHVEKDFIAFCSSTPHNVSWRDRTRGSIFITELITCFQKYSWCYHLMKIFQKVQKSFEIPKAKAQMPTIERVSLTRDFYLFPGN
ncbi:LOW QUALITY PROTEIN: caspase-5 [Trachypithecus francoisi]|uniref:LOW QUALITY PROTEIN: caspase-5 n=1 Tax=Trachypithecus francoisi TaxID=54180 RepID=UPI00141ABCC5|nr:LOW QUALITY PROTEIN: caspase-5 [Trachypithecus francoisi]